MKICDWKTNGQPIAVRQLRTAIPAVSQAAVNYPTLSEATVFCFVDLLNSNFSAQKIFLARLLIFSLFFIFYKESVKHLQMFMATQSKHLWLVTQCDFFVEKPFTNLHGLLLTLGFLSWEWVYTECSCRCFKNPCPNCWSLVTQLMFEWDAYRKMRPFDEHGTLVRISPGSISWDHHLNISHRTDTHLF